MWWLCFSDINVSTAEFEKRRAGRHNRNAIHISIYKKVKDLFFIYNENVTLQLIAFCAHTVKTQWYTVIYVGICAAEAKMQWNGFLVLYILSVNGIITYYIKICWILVYFNMIYPRCYTSQCMLLRSCAVSSGISLPNTFDKRHLQDDIYIYIYIYTAHDICYMYK